MNKRKRKLIITSALVILTILAFGIFVNSFASTTQATNSATALDVNELQPNFDKNSSSSKAIINVTRKVLEILQVLGIAIGLVMLVIIGIKYITSAGNKDDGPEIKTVIKNYIFGAFLIFGATGILTVIQQVVAQFDTAIY